MGLADILSNPGILGLAAAGLSRDPDAPMRAFGVLQGSNEMARQAQADEEKKLQRADTLRAAQEIMGGQNNEAQALINVLTKMQGIQQMPKTQTGFTENNLVGSATDLETGKSYDTEVPNVARMEESKKAWAEMQNIVHPAEAVLQLDKYPNADPATLITLYANKNNLRKEMVKSLFDMHQEELKDTRKHEREQSNIRLKGEVDKETEKVKAENKTEKLAAGVKEFYDVHGRLPANPKEYEAWKKKLKESPNIIAPPNKKAMGEDEGGQFVVDLETLKKDYIGGKKPRGSGGSAKEDKVKMFKEALTPGGGKTPSTVQSAPTTGKRPLPVFK
jgi:hypothetical protein